MADPIESSDQLDAELEALLRVGGTPEDFEAAVKELAPRLEKPVTHRALLRIARVGWTSYNGLADLPGDDLPEFRGRPWAELPPVPRRTDSGGPRRQQLEGEPLHEYIGYLAEHAVAELGVSEEEVLGTPFGRAVACYMSVLALPGFRDLVGWERSVDAHALGMLNAERGLRHLGEVGMSADQEEACFRWLHLATYDEVTDEHLDEMRARRAVRLAHDRQPAGAVAVMTCEVSVVGALWFQEALSSAPSSAMSCDQLLGLLDHWAADAEEPEPWVARREGFGHIGRLDLTPGAAATEAPNYAPFIHGHLMRWMVEEEVPFRPHMFATTTAYTASIHRRLVTWPAEDGQAPAASSAHLGAMKFVRQDGSVPLADELVLLAWLMDQRVFGIRLSPLLDARDKYLAAERGV